MLRYVILIAVAILEASFAFSPMHSLSSAAASSSSLLLLPTLHHPSRRTPSALIIPSRRTDPLRAAADGGDGDGMTTATSSSSVSLAEKMKSWEATDEEIRAATLGGVVPGLSAPGLKGFDGNFGNNDRGGAPGGSRTDAFDVGLYIAFPIMVLSCLAVSIDA
jgi:hypothetical protein